MSSSLRLRFFVPRVQLGGMHLGAAAGIETRLAPYMYAPVEHTAKQTIYPLAIPAGTTLSVPFELPFIGAQKLAVGFDRRGVLWLGVPNLPMIQPTVHSAVAPYIASDAAEGVVREGCVYYPLRLPPGTRLAIPVMSFGEVGLRVVETQALALR